MVLTCNFSFIFMWNFILDEHCSILQWAEVLSADAFSAFEDAGLDNSKVSWKELDTVLQLTLYNRVIIL